MNKPVPNPLAPNPKAWPAGRGRRFRRLTFLFVPLLCMLPGVMNGRDAVGTEPNAVHLEQATLGGGCFWCMDAVFERVPGVKKVTCGYAGGTTPNPTYEQVCTGTTGHAEVIQIEFDPAVVSYRHLLDFFWQVHDPTTLNRQGPDVGTQYRSIILYENDRQKAEAEESKKEAAKDFTNPIVTQIVPLAHFYPAEKYHQSYFDKNPHRPYCVLEIRPKVKKLEKILKH